jgi:hypothetical protein
MHDLGFGRFESLRIERGQVVLDPWPTTIQDIKFGACANLPEPSAHDLMLKHQLVAFFEYARSVESGVIRTLEVRGGLPFAMTIAHYTAPKGTATCA